MLTKHNGVTVIKRTILFLSFFLLSELSHSQSGETISFGKMFGPAGFGRFDQFSFLIPEGEKRVVFTSNEQQGVQPGPNDHAIYGGLLGSGARQRIALQPEFLFNTFVLNSTSPNGEILLYQIQQSVGSHTRGFPTIIRTDGTGEPIALANQGGNILGQTQFTSDSRFLIFSETIFDRLAPNFDHMKRFIFVADLEQALTSDNNSPLEPINTQLDVGSFRVSEHGKRILYQDESTGRLLSTDFSGVSTIELFNDRISTGAFSVDPDSNLALFADVSRRNLYKVDVVSGEFNIVASASTTETVIGRFSFMDSNTVVYDERSSDSIVKTTGIYRLDLDDESTQPLLSLPTIPNSTFSGISFSISQDRSSLIYGFTDSNSELGERRLISSIEIASGINNHFSQEFMPYGRTLKELEVSKNGALVAFVIDRDIESINELYLYSAESNDIKKVHPDFVAGQEVIFNSQFPSIEITPDSQRVLYRARQDSILNYDLYAANVADGSVTRVNTERDPSVNVFDFKVSPQGGFVVWNNSIGDLNARRLIDRDVGSLCFPLVTKAGAVSSICL